MYCQLDEEQLLFTKNTPATPVLQAGSHTYQSRIFCDIMITSPSKKVVSITVFPDNRSAGIISSSSAASMVCCHVFVEFGITKPNWKFHSSNGSPLKMTV